jgi:hypothetical protein
VSAVPKTAIESENEVIRNAAMLRHRLEAREKATAEALEKHRSAELDDEGSLFLASVDLILAHHAAEATFAEDRFKARMVLNAGTEGLRAIEGGGDDG